MPKLILPRRPPRPYLEPLGDENPLLGGQQLPWLERGVGDMEKGSIQTWDPAGDAFVPETDGAELYVPPMEAAPPQLPSPLDRTAPIEHEPHGLHEQLGTGAADQGPEQMGFLAHAVVIDNLSSKWLYVPGLRRFVPPESYGNVLIIGHGIQTAWIRVMTPAGHADSSVGSSAGPVYACWFEDQEAALANVSGVIMTA